MKKHLALILCCLLLAGCVPSVPDTPLVQDAVDISLLHYFSAPIDGGIDDMVAVFNAEQSEYRLKAVPLDHEAFKHSIVEDLKSETPPEVYSYWAGARVNAVLADLEPIDTLWEQAHLDDSFSTAIIKSAVEYEGHKYLIPITQHYVVMFYNKKVFADLGLAVPSTWAEFEKACQVIKSAGIDPIALGSKNRWPAQFWFDYLLLRTAGLEYRTRLLSGEASYLDPEVVHVFERLSTMVSKGYFTKNPESYDWSDVPMEDFATGKTAMMLMGTWALAALDREPYHMVAEEDFDYFEFPVIDESIPNIALGPIDGLVVPKKTEHIDGSKAVLTFMASEEAQRAMSVGSGALIPNSQVDETSYSPIQRRLVSDISKCEGWAFNYDLATPPEVAEIGLDLFKDFWQFPNAYEFLLKEADLKIKNIWDRQGRE